MVNRDRDLRKTKIGNTVYFVVPQPLANIWADYIKSHPGYEPTGKEDSHIKWDYTEWSASSQIADEGLEFLYQILLIIDEVNNREL